MNDYEFTLKFSLSDPSVNPEEYVELLHDVGCDDALIGIGKKGSIALNFIREAKSASDAVLSALRDVRRAIPNAKLIEATPDLVGLTDLAELLGFSRQYMRKIRFSYSDIFPPPVHEGKSAIWHLSKVLICLKEANISSIEDTLIDLAKINMQCNLVKEQLNADQELNDLSKELDNDLRTLIA